MNFAEEGNYMLEFFSENWGSLAVGALLTAAVAAVVVKLIKDKKSGKSSCCGDCSKCSGCAMEKKRK